jgi:outer membrane protein OmpA-like peptidoglycan-associated protein
MKRILTFAVLAAFLVAGFGCTRTQKGTAIGGTAGSALGAIIGDRAGNTAVGAIIGAAVGGAAGAYIGHYMDEQAAEMDRDLEGARVERVGEGIKITFDSGILFDVNKADLRPAARANLEELAKILQKYPDTNVLVEGHTDSTGTEEHNLVLSNSRAESVRHYLVTLGTATSRFSTVGYGESQPIASNDTAEGRQANRRVEIAVMANDKLKAAAERKTQG